MKRYSSKKELVFENPSDKERLIDPGLRSSIEVFSANRVNASRSGGYSIAHFSEVAFYTDAENLITSTTPSIPDATNTVKVYESTANGRGGFFHTEWMKAKDSLTARRKTSNFFPVFFSWLQFPDYSTSFNNSDERHSFEETMDDEEREVAGKYGATLEQLHWRRNKILDLNGDIDKFHQEYPCDDIEAFISSGLSYFSRRKLREMLDKCIPPNWVGDIGALGFTENDDGPLFLWEKPKVGDEYVVSADVGGGVVGGDPSVIQVLRVPSKSPQIAQVAEWRDWIDPISFAGKIINMAKWYNEALVVPETNNHGFATLNEIKRVYWNIYQWQYFDRFGTFVSKKLGWECVDPESVILMSDLTWKKAKEINLGDQLIGCEDASYIKERSGKSRKLKNQTVTDLKKFIAKRVAVKLSDGRTIKVSSNHPFLVMRSLMNQWAEAQYLHPGDLIRNLPVWSENRTYEAGRLSGLLDGEGYLAANSANPTGLQLMITQQEGALADEILDLWNICGFNVIRKYARHHSTDRAHEKAITCTGMGIGRDVLQALGSIRPKRLLSKFIDQNFIERITIKSLSSIVVESIEEIEDGEVIGITTDPEHTLIADGLVSHNTNGSTKPIMCDYTSGCINADLLVIRSSALIDEMMSFIKKPIGGAEADVNCYDDRVMAFMIGLFTLGHSFHTSSILERMGLVGDAVMETEKLPKKLRPSSVTHDLDEYLEDERMVDQSDRSWLNY
jgi:hypothetical protein